MTFTALLDELGNPPLLAALHFIVTLLERI